MYSMMPAVNSSVSLGGGRFDFDDGGTYCGGWQDGKAHGHGVCTGPKGLGEYSGSWDFGFEVSGVYKWQNGAVYEGKWQNGKRHGVGVEYNGKWIYKGEWTQGYKGRYGVRSSSISAVKYEGTWANGLQDGYGCETYADGGSYQGQWCRGTRHGYGVRASAPYGDKNSNNQHQNSNSDMVGSKHHQLNRMSSSPHSNPMHPSAMDIDDDEPFLNETRPTTERLKASNNGFVLVAKTLDPTPVSSKYGDKSQSGRRNSLTIDKASHSRIPGNYAKATLLRGLRFKKQRSTGDLDSNSGRHTPGSISPNQGGSSGSGDYELGIGNSGHTGPLALSPDELDINDPTTVETYMGEWKQDKRSGHGVCERSDGLKYEGQWHNDMKCGYGITTHRDGIKEEGKYKNNCLIVDSKVKKIFQIRGQNIRQKIDEAVELAIQARDVAEKKSDIAITRAATSRDKAEQATERATDAIKDSRIAHSVAKQYSDSQQAQQAASSSAGAIHVMGAPGSLHASILAGSGVGSGHLENQLRRRLSYFAHHHGGPGVKSGGMHDVHYQTYEYDDDPTMMSIPTHNQLIDQHHHQQQTTNNNHLHMQQQQQHRHSLGVHDPINNNAVSQQQLQQQDQMQQQQQQQKQRYLGPLEPFGGRRGSFRVSAGGALPTSNSISSNPYQMQGSSLRSRSSGGGGGGGMTMLLQTDPFNDHFDHYRTSNTGSNTNNSSFDSGRSTSRSRFLKKQTSFDNSNHQLLLRQQYNTTTNNNTNAIYGSNSNQTPSPLSSGLGMNNTNVSAISRRNSFDLNGVDMNDHQHQFSHLVTSGEDLLLGADSTTGTPHASSTFYGDSQTSSPSPTTARLIGRQQQHHHNHLLRPSPSSAATTTTTTASLMQIANLQNTRSGSEPRQTRNYGLQRQTTTNNYDFSISTPPSGVRTRRTASLTRHPILPLSMVNNNSNSPSSASASISRLFEQSRNLATAGINSGSIASISASKNIQPNQQQQPGVTFNQLNHHQSPALTNEVLLSSKGNLGASGSNLSRKPSLQVRYDPQALGGIMSREEVAALSHAQREQRRFEVEMAERRRRNPLLYFFITVKELINRQKLVLAVLIVNIILFFIFADLLS